MKISANRQNVSVTVAGSCASASLILINGANAWLVNRVFVEDEQRGHGVGHNILKTLINECLGINSHAPIYVVPGGYDTPIKWLRKWYVRQGFKPTFDNVTYVYEKNIK